VRMSDEKKGDRKATALFPRNVGQWAHNLLRQMAKCQRNVALGKITLD